MQPVVLIVLGLLGVAVGSFVNVVAYRVPLGKSVVRPRSFCPNCETSIGWKDNIPIVSWLMLGGKCRHCGERISVRYLVVEVACGALFAGTALVLGPVAVLPAFLWFMAATLALVLTDLDHKRLPDRIVFPSLGVGVVLLTAGAFVDGTEGNLPRALIGALVYAGILLVIFIGALLILRKEGFGFGDVKLGLLLGLFTFFVSRGAGVASVILAFLIGGGLSVLLLLLRRVARQDELPFGPSMIVAAWIAVTWGDQLVRWYLGI